MANEKQDFSRYHGFPRLKIVQDIYRELGPLGGIYTGLTASVSTYNLVVACDMPFLSIDLIRYMIELKDDFDVIAPRKGEFCEPLHAIYSRKCLRVIEELIAKGELQVNKLYARLKVRYIEDAEIERFDPKHLSFFNINTEAELNKAKGLIGI